jgi:hypothetical protein
MIPRYRTHGWNKRLLSTCVFTINIRRGKKQGQGREKVIDLTQYPINYWPHNLKRRG